MEQSGLYIGLMSGTSVDAIDVVAVNFPSEKTIDVIASHTHEIPSALKQKIIELNHSDKNELHQIMCVDMELGSLFADAANTLISKEQLNRKEIIAIGSHGQTLRHQIEVEPRYTLQVGNPHLIAELTGITTVADFRTRDIVAGGQGAPLVPAFHKYLFSNSEQDRIILNVGGMANLTFLWAREETQGFDTGPGNVLLDYWFRKHYGDTFDKDGIWASSGKTDKRLLSTLLSERYFSQPPPKSTGRELFDGHWIENQIKNYEISAENLQKTLLTLSVESISKAIEKWGPDSCDIYVCGGGACNPYFMECLADRLDSYSVFSTKQLGLDPVWVEACAFAWLAKRCLEGLPGNLPSVTGASADKILGAIYPV